MPSFWILVLSCTLVFQGCRPVSSSAVNEPPTPTKIDMPVEPRPQPGRPLDIVLGTRGADPSAPFVPRIVAKADTGDIELNGSSIRVPRDMTLKFSDNVSVPLFSAALALQEAKIEIEQVRVKIELTEAQGDKLCLFRSRFRCTKGKTVSVYCNPVYASPRSWVGESEGGCEVVSDFPSTEIRDRLCYANFPWVLGTGICLALTTKTAVTP